jgi:hypothetical protein
MGLMGDITEYAVLQQFGTFEVLLASPKVNMMLH